MDDSSDDEVGVAFAGDELHGAVAVDMPSDVKGDGLYHHVGTSCHQKDTDMAVAYSFLVAQASVLFEGSEIFELCVRALNILSLVDATLTRCNNGGLPAASLCPRYMHTLDC